MKTPMISVVMPVYHGQKQLKEAINSILDQIYTKSSPQNIKKESI